MKAKPRTPMHARTHLPGGSDPLPLSTAGLPPWGDWSDLIELKLSSVDAGTAPAVDVVYAWMMIQTEDGNSWFPADDPDGGVPFDGGTVHGIARVYFTDAGTPPSDVAAALIAPIFLTDLSPSVDRAFVPIDPATGSERAFVTCGYGTITDWNTTGNPRYPVKVTLSGLLIVDGIPDPYFPGGSYQNYVRIVNPSADDPGFPFAIASGASLDWAFTYALQRPVE